MFLFLGIFEANQIRVEWHSEVLCGRNTIGYTLPIVTLKIPKET